MVTTALGTGTGTAKYLREDGTWATPPDTDTKYSKLSQFTNDAGFITGITGIDVTTALGYTPPKQDTTYETASSTSDGLMTSEMVTKLNSIAEGANNYTHPAYTAKVSGLYKVTVDATGHVSATTAVTKADITSLGIPGSDTWQANVLNAAGYVAAPTSDTINKVWKTDADGNPGWRDDENTVYGVASATSDGLMTSEMVTKLNSIAEGANRITNNNQLTNGAGYITGITKEMVTTALGYTPPTQDTTYETVSSKSNGLMTPALLSKLNGIAEGANKYTHPSYTAKVSGLYKVTVDASGHVSAATVVTKSDITGLGIPGSDTNTHYTTKLYAGASDGSANATTSNGGTHLILMDDSTVRNRVKISGSGATSVTSDANGNITISSTDTNTTYFAATTSSNGLMTSAMVTKLNGIAEGANKYTHPAYTAKTSGLYKVTVDASGHVSAATAVTKDDITALGIPGSDTNSWRGIQNNLTSDSTTDSLSAAQGKALKALVDGKVSKTTYEYNKELALGSTGKVCIGKFPCYDSNITVEIKSTTNTTYNGTLIIATQNINTSLGGSYECAVYGDEKNKLAASIKIGYVSGSNVFSVYIDLPLWSKNLLHIQCVSLAGNPTDIATKVDSIPTTATIVPTNAFTHTHSSIIDAGNNSTVTTFAYSKAGLGYSDYTWLAGWNGSELRAVAKSQFATAGHTHNYAGSSSAGGVATSAIGLTGVYIQSDQPSTPSSGYVEWFKTIRTE